MGFNPWFESARAASRIATADFQRQRRALSQPSPKRSAGLGTYPKIFTRAEGPI